MLCKHNYLYTKSCLYDIHAFLRLLTIVFIINGIFC